MRKGRFVMKLEQMLITIEDTTNVVIVDAESGDILAKYNGKDAIPTNLNDCEVVSMHVDGDCLVIAIVNEWVPTEKFNLMIQTFECDFNLAEEGDYEIFQKLQDGIKKKQQRIMNDIHLLQELSFLLRYGKARIVVQKGEE